MEKGKRVRMYWCYRYHEIPYKKVAAVVLLRISQTVDLKCNTVTMRRFSKSQRSVANFDHVSTPS